MALNSPSVRALTLNTALCDGFPWWHLLQASMQVQSMEIQRSIAADLRAENEAMMKKISELGGSQVG